MVLVQNIWLVLLQSADNIRHLQNEGKDWLDPLTLIDRAIQEPNQLNHGIFVLKDNNIDNNENYELLNLFITY